jgi:uracil phosphoribosyltransferase
LSGLPQWHQSNRRLAQPPALTTVIAPFSKSRRIAVHPVSRDADETSAGAGCATAARRPEAPRNINIVEHPIALNALAALRSTETAPEKFRACCGQLLLLLAVESTRTLPIRESSFGPVSGTDRALALGKPVILLSITRHGLGLAHQVADFVPNLSVGLINLGKPSNDGILEPRLHLVNAPALSDARILLFNPVVATGMSTSIALNLLRSSGAEDVTLLSFLTSAAGLNRVLDAVPGLIVWTTSVDSGWDSKHDSFPSLGDFGERLYG